MCDTRLINQVLVWERRIEIENENHKNHRPENNEHLPIALEPCRKEHKSILARVLTLSLNRNYSIHASEPAGSIDGPVYSEA